jgi:chromosome segregation ATPase
MEAAFHSDDLMEQTRSEVRRMKRLIDLQQEQHDRRTRTFAIILGALALLLLAALWTTYPILRDQRKTAAGMLGVKNVATDLGTRIDSVETNMGKMTTSLPALTEQFQANMKANLQAARDQAIQLEQRIRSNVNQSIQQIQSRVSGLESNQKEASQHVNQLQTEIARLNEELMSMRQQASTSAEEIKQLKDAQETSSHDLSGLNERVSTSQASLAKLANRVDRKRLDFNISNRERTAQVAPNVKLTLKGVDVRKQQVDALLQFGSNAPDLPIRGQAIRKPVLFYQPNGSQAIELVLTQITKDGVAGYLMMPVQQKASTQ